MNTDSLVLVFGAGGHAKVIIDIIEKQSIYTIFGVVDPADKSLFNYKTILDDAAISKLNINKGIIAVGDNQIRNSIRNKVKKLIPHFEFITAIHPSAQLGRDVSIGEGTVIMAGACINSSTHIGSHCIINTNASVDHDCTIGDYTSIAPGATLGGSTNVGAHSTICIGAVISNNLTIGDNCTVGAGSTVLNDVPHNSFGYGTPFKVMSAKL